ncbi:hypothetical protein J6590_099991 [Homalodisca vitripennis]|nr:hypothetical protein J6590_099991 [Homalodisca vitripennis]
MFGKPSCGRPGLRKIDGRNWAISADTSASSSSLSAATVRNYQPSSRCLPPPKYASEAYLPAASVARCAFNFSAATLLLACLAVCRFTNAGCILL